MLAIKKNEIMPFVATWKDLEILTEASQREKYHITYMWNLEKKKMQMNLEIGPQT